MMKCETPAAVDGPAICSNCNSQDRLILHHVHHHNTFLRLCTTCVLKLHITYFCPLCFSLHDRFQRPPPPPSRAAPAPILICIRCHSATHAACLHPNSPKTPYICCSTSNPSPKFVDFRKNGADQKIDLKSSQALLAAATIALNSLTEVEERLRVEAERKARESVATKKKAKSDLDRAEQVRDREKERDALGVSVGGLTLKKEEDRAVVAPGRPLMGGTTVINNGVLQSNGLVSGPHHR